MAGLAASEKSMMCDTEHCWCFLQDLYGPEDAGLLRFRADAHDMAGWVAIRPGKPETFNLELDYQLLRK